MRFERTWGEARRIKLEAWATRENPWCVFRACPQVWLCNRRLTASFSAAICGVGFQLSTYYRAKQ